MISIVIPAKDEANRIAGTLYGLVEGALPGEIDVVVVCNGCSDKTAAIARSCGGAVRVVESAIAGKAHALNIGDSAVGAVFPRVYVDGDVRISVETIRALARRLSEGDVLAVAPIGHVDTSGCSLAVRWFFDVAAQLPSAKQGIGGSGVYALSRAGRSRFRDFPNLIADDAFVRIQFSASECDSVPALSAIVSSPRKIKDLIRVRTRIRYGHLELARLYPRLWRQNWQSNNKAVLRLMGRCTLWPKLLIYFYVIVISRTRARRRFRKKVCIWERDREPHHN